MGVGTRSSAKKSKGNIRLLQKACVLIASCLDIPLQACQQIVDVFVSILEEEESQAKMATKVGIDVETQTDPEITGVDADDFEEEDDGEETGSGSSESEDEEAGEDGQSKSVDKGTSSKPVRRKIIELKYYFGEDLPDAELSKREFGVYNFSPSTWSVCIN